MTSRFTPNRMTPWRQRFLAIARELDASPARRRGPHNGRRRSSALTARAVGPSQAEAWVRK